MKTIIRISQLVSLMILLSISLTACSQTKTAKSETATVTKEIPKKIDHLDMNKDTLSSKVSDKLDEEIVKKRAEITQEALSTIEETGFLVNLIAKGKKEDAIKKGKELIGNLEILLAKDPSLALIPVNVNYQKEETVVDIETVRKVVASAKEAMDKGYYRLAADLLNNMKSEMIVNTYLIPTATYPQAIKDAVILLEDDKSEDAKILLLEILNTVIIQKTVLPLPVLNAEQMIIEAATIDAENHDNVSKVINLLDNADYQLNLAEELGYGKKDKEFAVLAKSIEELKESVTNKEDSAVKFDSLKSKIKKFQERLFQHKKEETK